MEAKREERVWQRVGAPPLGGQSREELNILLQNAGERAALFQSLAGQTQRAKEKVRQLRELEQVNLTCIQGMMAFSGWDHAAVFRKPTGGPVRQNLIRGYYLAKKGAAEYTARSVDPEFGVVYQEMAARENRVCNLVTELLGEM